MSDNPYRLGVDQIQKYLPHRAPFLMIDRVLEIHLTGSLDDVSPASRVGIRVVALKNVTFNEPCFQGHFPGFAIFPGVLLVEAMAQTAGFSLYPYVAKDLDRMARDFRYILVGVDGARFRRPVVPGDSLRIETVVTKCRGRLWAFDCTVSVEGAKVAEAQLITNIVASTEIGEST